MITESPAFIVNALAPDNDKKKIPIERKNTKKFWHPSFTRKSSLHFIKINKRILK